MTVRVVCLDGTDQEIDQKHPTNITKMFKALGGTATSAGHGSFEVANGSVCGKYLPGVGTQGSETLKMLGDLFGDGIAELIVRGYTYLSRTWTAGDEIVLTGFSRGATAARALAGLVSARGLLDPARYPPDNKEAAYERAVAAWYLYRSHDPSLTNQFRLAAMQAMLGHPLPSLTAADFKPAPPIRAVGVFDTVSSLGVPNFSNGAVHFDFSICDTALSPNIQHGFHALAADETREIFSPTYWQTRAGVVQTVFPGCHSNVGGGFADCKLSDVALVWMLDQIEPLGVPFERTWISPTPDPRWDGLIQDDGRRPPFFGLMCRGRSFPDSATPHASLRQRLNQPNNVTPHLPGDYRPAGAYADGRPLA